MTFYFGDPTVFVIVSIIYIYNYISHDAIAPCILNKPLLTPSLRLGVDSGLTRFSCFFFVYRRSGEPPLDAAINSAAVIETIFL